MNSCLPSCPRPPGSSRSRHLPRQVDPDICRAIYLLIAAGRGNQRSRLECRGRSSIELVEGGIRRCRPIGTDAVEGGSLVSGNSGGRIGCWKGRQDFANFRAVAYRSAVDLEPLPELPTRFSEEPLLHEQPSGKQSRSSDLARKSHRGARRWLETTRSKPKRGES